MIAFWLPDVTDDSSHLSDLLLINACDGDVGLLDGYFNAVDSLNDIIMGMADVKHEVFAPHFTTIADALDFEALGEPFGHTFDHIFDERTGCAVDHPHRDGIIRTFDMKFSVLLLDIQMLIDLGG